ncbi:uncharacterized protein LOC119733250 [Patiria miniata]|uniref:Uncharacterized protein n=1 Tax=Patiria miniata TaxID=46514 RepID=A0A914AFL3_PATMI|nr:uncharacterized protein LOC119733250 [Patiria miniata]
MAQYSRRFKLLCCCFTISLLVNMAWLPGYFQNYAHRHRIPSPTKIPSPFKRVGLLSSSNTTDVGAETDLDATHGFSLALTIRMAAVPKLVQRLYCIFIRSSTVFWSPKLGPISLILDKESETDHRFARQLKQQEKDVGLKFDFVYEPLPDTASGWKPQGYQRQLWSSFFMDLFINASVIGLTDTDAVFTTPVTPENIFNGRRLRVLTYTDTRRMRHREEFQESTLQALGKVMASDFKAYFPSYYWRDTITNCRNHIMKHMNVTHFDDAFRQLRHVSPVDIILNYAYFFEQDRYDWHLDFKQTLKGYNAKLPPGVNIQRSETKPDVHVAIHKRYYNKPPDPLLQGYCVAKRYVGTLPTSCLQFQNVTNFQLFEFDDQKGHLIRGTWCSGKRRQRCIRYIEAHYQNVKKYYNLGWYDLDLRRITAVEEVARRENMTCPKIFQLD